MKKRKLLNTISISIVGLSLIFITILLNSCSPASSASNQATPTLQVLPVISINSYPVSSYREFTASLEGNRDIEIRPQVDGYLDKIYVDEGAAVHKGELLFHIDARSYQEQLNNAKANLLSAKAALESAQINVDKLTPLVQNNVVSPVQLRSAQASYDAAKANVAQAQSAVSSANINLDFTNIVAPADGFIGSIPLKTGSLVGKSTMEPLTILSETKEMHVYFSMSETDFLNFKDEIQGSTIEEKIKHLPDVELVMSNDSIYPQKGKVEIVQGQFDRSTGAINFRATFPNTLGLLRSGNTGKIRIPQQLASSVIVPQSATFDVQDKIFVFAINDSNQVTGKPITVSSTAGNYYVVTNGLNAGDKIVYQGLSRLHDGMKIDPQQLSLDSLVKKDPL